MPKHLELDNTSYASSPYIYIDHFGNAFSLGSKRWWKADHKRNAIDEERMIDLNEWKARRGKEIKNNSKGKKSAEGGT